jgi:hypothetical protein
MPAQAAALADFARQYATLRYGDGRHDSRELLERLRRSLAAITID